MRAGDGFSKANNLPLNAGCPRARGRWIIVVIKWIRYPIRGNAGEPISILPGSTLNIYGTEATAGVVTVVLDAGIPMA